MPNGWVTWEDIAGHTAKFYKRAKDRNGEPGRGHVRLRAGWDDIPDGYILNLARRATRAGDGVLYTMAPAGFCPGVVICHMEQRSRLYTRDADELAEFMERWTEYYSGLSG